MSEEESERTTRLRKVPPSPLPDHVAAGEEWKAWPRKIEAHVVYGARERQVTALCRSGKLVVWRCPDESLRLDPDALEGLFGKPGTFQGRDRAPSDEIEREVRKSRKAAEFDHSDPLPGLVKELTLLLREQREEKIQILKLVVDPMNFALQLFRELTGHAMARCEKMEKRELDNLALYEELTSSRHARDLETKAAEGTQKRREEIMGLLRKRLPDLLDGVTGIGSLAAFVKTLDPELIKTLLETGILPKDKADQLRKAAGIDDKTVNGKASHGVDGAAQQQAGVS